MEALMRNISVVIGAFVALVLHIVVAPALNIELIYPNIIFAFCVALSIVRPSNVSIVTSFVLGILGGLLSVQAPGIMAGVLIVISFLLTRIFSVLDNTSVFMVAVSVMAALFLAELAYGFMLIQFGMGVSLFSLLIYRIIPCALYDIVAAFVLYTLVHHLIGPQPTATQIPVAQFR